MRPIDKRTRQVALGARTQVHRYMHTTRANDEGVRQPITFFVTDGKKNNSFVLLGFSRKHHKPNIYSKYPDSHVSERMSVQEFGV